ncbi:MAG: hypothetical protein AAF974_02150 [Cyanobacteria bacterium P01_E01_bin.34]
MAHATAVDMAIRDFYAEDVRNLDRIQLKQKRLGRTIDRLRSRVKVEHEEVRF